MATIIPVQPTGSNVHFRSDFARLLEPGLRKIFFESYAEVPEQFSKIYNVLSSTKAMEIDYGLGAFGDWHERGSEIDTVTYDKLHADVERVYVHKAYDKGFMITREQYDDEQYGQMNKMPAAMARAGRAYVEKQAAIPIHNGFLNATPIYNGKALFSDAHPLVDGGSATGSNLVTGALNDTNLKLALKCMRETVDEAGNLIGSFAKKLVVPPSLEHTAKALLNSTQLVGTNLNDINTVKGALDIVVWDYMGEAGGGSESAWFIMDPTLAQLNFFWRIKPEFKSAEEFDNFVAKYRGYMRFSYGVSDWRGVVGSLGGTASAKPTVGAIDNDDTAVSVSGAVSGANLKLYVNGKVAQEATASGTTHSFTITALPTGTKVFVVQTESTKVPTESAGKTVVDA